jgi:uncharacterized protein YndB with AHSA1/START domain
MSTNVNFGQNSRFKTGWIVLVNSVLIRRSIEEVFDYCSDLENELQWNPNGLVSLEALSSRPIEVGTKYVAHWKGSPPMTCEYTRIERPGVWEVYAAGKGMGAAFRGQVTGQGDETRLTVTMALRPQGLLRLLAPIIRGEFQRGEVKNLANVKAQMEGSARPH